MKGIEYIKSKQIAWGTRKALDLVGSTINNKGQKIYVPDLNDNLFKPLSKETQLQFNNADGGELKDSLTNLAKMKALHSSSAIVVNIFQYWQDKDITPIIYTCGLCSKKNQSVQKIIFEKKFKISSKFNKVPNIDIVVENNTSSQYKVYAIESKFSEPYGSYKHGGIDPKYFHDDILLLWNDIPKLKKVSESISPDDNKFKYLHPAQLIKHILGLKKQHGKSGFHLLYLWYDVLGEEGTKHREEINQFAEIVKQDNIIFSHTTYQEIIKKISTEFHVGNESYCDYITDRYF